MIKLSVICIVLLLLSLIDYSSNLFLYALLYIITTIINIFLILYLISILQFAKESFAIQTPFSIFLGLEIIGFLSQMFFSHSTGTLTEGIGILNFVIIIYVLIATFRVQSKKLAEAFGIFGIALLLNIILKFGLTFIIVIPGKPFQSRFIGIINLIPLLAILHIIYQTGKVLKNAETDNPGHQITNNT